MATEINFFDVVLENICLVPVLRLKNDAHLYCFEKHQSNLIWTLTGFILKKNMCEVQCVSLIKYSLSSGVGWLSVYCNRVNVCIQDIY